jgi:hypothetical protein
VGCVVSEDQERTDGMKREDIWDGLNGSQTEEISVNVKVVCTGTLDGQHEWQDATKNTIVTCRACGKIKSD